MIEAFARAADAFPGTELALVGEGECEAALRTLAKRKGIAESVVFHGWREDVAAFYRWADIFVLPSRWEGLPNALIEAMVHGCAAVAFDCPSGPSEVITEPGGNGLLVPCGDVDALADALGRLIADRDLRRRLAQMGRERSRDFSVTACVAAFDRLIRAPAP